MGDYLPTIEGATRGLTFSEAFKRSGRTLCITCTPSGSNLSGIVLNHLNAPDVLISTAVLASMRLPGLYPPVCLREKKSFSEEGGRLSKTSAASNRLSPTESIWHKYDAAAQILRWFPPPRCAH